MNAATVLAVALAAAGAGGPDTRPAGERTAYAQWKNGPPADPSYFPVAVWLQDPKNAEQFKKAGINLYVGLWKGPTEAQLAALRKAGMPVICAQNAVGLAHKDDPIIVGWMHGDEPDNAQLIVDPVTKQKRYGGPVPPARVVEAYDRLRAADPTRPILLNLGQGVANDEWIGRGSGARPDDYLTYVKGADIVSFDVYPVAGINKPDGENYLWYVPKGVDRLVKWTGGKKIVWNCIECTHISSPRKATPAQVRAQVWMALIHGSTGLIYFVHQFKPRFIEAALLEDAEMLAAVANLNAEIRNLAPVLNSATVDGLVTVTSSAPTVPVDYLVKRHGGAVYIFAAGMRNAATTATFEARDLPASATAEVIGEDRRVEVRDGRFADDFAPHAVHLYRLK